MVPPCSNTAVNSSYGMFRAEAVRLMANHKRGGRDVGLQSAIRPRRVGRIYLLGLIGVALSGFVAVLPTIAMMFVLFVLPSNVPGASLGDVLFEEVGRSSGTIMGFAASGRK